MAANASIVEYWEDLYVPKYTGDSYTDVYLSQVDTHVLYSGLESLAIKAVGDTTGVDSINWFDDIPKPDIRNPFDVMVIFNDYIYIYIVVKIDTN